MLFNFPENFYFAQSALDEIKVLLKNAEKSHRDIGWIVAVVWMQTETQEGELKRSGPGIAIYDERQLEQEAIINIDGVKVVFPSPNPEIFNNKQLFFEESLGFYLN